MTIDEVTDLLRSAGCVFAEDEAALLVAESAPAELTTRLARRVAGEPLEHVLGFVEFDGQRLAVGPGVFVPRRRTELLARVAAGIARRGDVVVDLCCGCGAVAAAVGRRVPDVELYAVDVDPLAASYAAQNLAGRGVVAVGDLFAALPVGLLGRADVITANAPYVPEGALATLPREARDHEPRRALLGGADGLEVHRRIFRAAPEWLAPGGVLLVETGRRQVTRTQGLMTTAGLHPRAVHRDESGGTVVEGVQPAAAADRGVLAHRG